MFNNFRYPRRDIVRKSYTILITLVVLLSMAMSVQALESKIIQRQNGVTANAYWTEKNGDITTDTFLTVTKSDTGTDILLDIYTNGPNDWSDKHGSMFTQDNVFNVDNKLNSASLSEVNIDVYDFNTGEIKTETVKADWIGKGFISKDSFKSVSKSGSYIWTSNSINKFRDATATSNINGLDLGVSQGANLVSFKTAYMEMRK